MTIRYMPFDAGAGADVMEDGWSRMARQFVATGVLNSGPFALAAPSLEVFADSSGMQVKVRAGFGAIHGHYYDSDATQTLPVTAANGSNPRITTVVLRLDSTNNLMEVDTIDGAAAASPSAPSLTQTEGSVWEIPLAQVEVGTGVSTIAADKVTDSRWVIPSADNAPRGLACDPVIQTSDLTTTATAQTSSNGLETDEFYVPANQWLEIEFSARGFRHENADAAIDVGIFTVPVGGSATQRGGGVAWITDTPVTTQHAYTRAFVQLTAGLYTVRQGFWTPSGGGSGSIATLSAQSTEPAFLTVKFASGSN